MTLMQLIKTVLDDLYNRIHIQSDEAKDEQIKAEIAQISREYNQLTNMKAKPINYSEASKRFAYIYKYTVAHADYIMQVIGENALLCIVHSI